MYTPRPFAVDDDTARHLLRSITVGQLVTATDDGPLATLMPWLPDLGNAALVGHMARSNDQWQVPWLGQAMVITEGPNAYVSPSWYASKAEHGRVVPTWNYVVVQIHGDLIVHDDASWVADAVRRLTNRYEHGRTDPWSVDDAPADYIDGQLRGIVGIELRIARVEASLKMSQNRTAADAEGVIAGLTADGIEDVADWVQRSQR
ncbi:MAG: FMN-binding negative transcriptional regulator [Phycisphaerales bacterium]